ncbi:uncharacterized protein VTP21DRAFT_11739 [Calcarisporiella thermophila]|uniref:uncharacterized protein n=1 Tax=Calcarisporiella thermophila TaxID=911321 RepID=UPI003744228A
MPALSSLSRLSMPHSLPSALLARWLVPRSDLHIHIAISGCDAMVDNPMEMVPPYLYYVDQWRFRLPFRVSWQNPIVTSVKDLHSSPVWDKGRTGRFGHERFSLVPRTTAEGPFLLG